MENRSEGTLTGARKASVLDCLYVRAELVLEVTWKRWILATRLPACYISKMGKMGPTKSPDEVVPGWLDGKKKMYINRMYILLIRELSRGSI